MEMIKEIKYCLKWNKRRIKRNYQKIIETYSEEDQSLIKKGRKMEITFDSLEGLEKFLKEREKDKTLEVMPLLEKRVIYMEIDIFSQRYEINIEHWKYLGRLGAEGLCSIYSGPKPFAGELTNMIAGIPVKILR